MKNSIILLFFFLFVTACNNSISVVQGNSNSLSLGVWKQCFNSAMSYVSNKTKEAEESLDNCIKSYFEVEKKVKKMEKVNND